MVRGERFGRPRLRSYESILTKFGDGDIELRRRALMRLWLWRAGEIMVAIDTLAEEYPEHWRKLEGLRGSRLELHRTVEEKTFWQLWVTRARVGLEENYRYKLESSRALGQNGEQVWQWERDDPDKSLINGSPVLEDEFVFVTGRLRSEYIRPVETSPITPQVHLGSLVFQVAGES